MKRAAVFAHYNQKGDIEDYVVYYLKNLKSCVQTLVFVSDGEIRKEELRKIQAYADKIIVKNHGEYDFGSYKSGYLFLKENNKLELFDELIFANDSCYAPLFSFEKFFKIMSAKNADFWGNTQNRLIDKKNCSPTQNSTQNLIQNNTHIQSYFLVFKKNVFSSEVFENFMLNIKKENSKEQVILKYEIGLSKLLLEHGFKYEVFCPISKKEDGSHILFYDKLVSIDKSPFLKRNLILLKEISFQYPVFIKKLIKNTLYNYDLIKNDINKNGQKISLFLRFKLFLRTLRRKMIKIHFKQKKIYLFGKEIALYRS